MNPSQTMSTNSNDLKNILQIPSEERIEFEKEILHFAVMRNIQQHLGKRKYSSIASEIGVSKSFISQLFSGDKKINIDLMVKFQRALKFKFQINSLSIEEKPREENVIQMFSYDVPIYISTTKSNLSSSQNLNPTKEMAHA